MLTHQKYVLCATREVSLIFFGESWYWERIPPQGIRVPKICFQLAADGGNPDQVQTRCNECKVPDWGVVESKGEVTNY